MDKMDAETLAWVVGCSSVAVGLTFICCTICCVRRGCCGPRSLTKGDVDALATFKDIYFYQRIDIREGYFDQADETAYCKLRKYTLPSKPVATWSSLMHGSSSGFLVHIAKEIDEHLLAYQHRMWKAKGDFVSYMPTFLVAQEWREWAMTELQRIESPDLEHKEMLDRRLRWIANAREVARTEIMNLRHAEGWDETDELSLLVVLRQYVGRELRMVHDRWSCYQMQLSFEFQASQITGFMTQFVRSGANFLRKILRQDKVQDNDFILVVESGNILTKPCTFCNGVAIYEQHALDRQLEHWLEEVSLFDAQFPSKFRALFFTEKRLKELEDGTAKIQPLKPLSPFAKWDESRLDFEEREVAEEVITGFKPEQFGLEEQDFKVMVQRCVTMFSALKYCTASIMVIESLKNFARLGGALFLAEQMSTEHVAEIMTFISMCVESTESDLIAIADKAQAGWSNLRRGDHQSPWSNTDPVDNVRAALHVKSDMIRIARDTQETVRLIQVETMKAQTEDGPRVEQKLENELQFHLQLWQLISKHFEKGKPKNKVKESPRPKDQATITI